MKRKRLRGLTIVRVVGGGEVFLVNNSYNITGGGSSYGENQILRGFVRVLLDGGRRIYYCCYRNAADVRAFIPARFVSVRAVGAYAPHAAH